MQDTSRVLRVHAVDPTGAAVAGVALRIERGDWNATVTTGPDGRAEVGAVPPGPRPVWVHTHPVGEWVGDKALSEVLPEEVEVKLARTPSVRVRVLDGSGLPIEGAAVLADDDWGRSRSLEVKQRTGPDGTCGWRGPVPGPHWMGVALEVGPGRWQWPEVARWVELLAGEETLVAFQLQRPAPGALECRVRFASGGPAAGVELWLQHHEAEGWSIPRKAAVTQDGTARFAGLQPGRYRLQSSGSPSAQGTAVAIAGATLLDLVVPDRSDLPVLVVDEQGQLVAGASVLSQVVETSEQQEAVTDAQGRATLAQVAHGAVYLLVRGDSGRSHLPTIPHDGSLQRVVLHPTRTLVVRGEAAGLDGDRVRVVRGESSSFGQVEGGRFEVPCALPLEEAGTVAVRVGDKVPIVRAFGAGDTVVDLGRLMLQDGAILRGQVADEGWSRRGGFTWIEVRCPSAGIVYDRIARDGTFRVSGLPRETVELSLSVGSPTPDRRWKKARLTIDLAASSGDLGLVELSLEEEDG